MTIDDFYEIAEKDYQLPDARPFRRSLVWERWKVGQFVAWKGCNNNEKLFFVDTQQVTESEFTDRIKILRK